MIEFGNTLRAAREARGYDIAQLAEMTRMAPKTIRELEVEDFTHIAAPIYGRGFVKLYCEAVGLDPKTLVTEFMEIYSGNRSSDIRERPTKSDSAPSTTQEPEPPEVPTPEPKLEPATEPDSVTPPPVAKMVPDLFNLDAYEPPATSPASVPEPTPARSAAPEPEPTLSRYAAPIRQDRAKFDPRVYLRLGILAAGAILFLVIIGYSIRTVYHATTSCTEDAPSAVQPKATAPAPAVGKQAKTARTPQKIPSLYLD